MSKFVEEHATKLSRTREELLKARAAEARAGGTARSPEPSSGASARAGSLGA